MNERNKLLKVENVSKNFGGVQALDNVSFDVYEGEILGIVGDNGAGKSTLIKTIGGLFEDYKGSIYFNGEEKHLHSYEKAQELGIEIIYQELALVDLFSVVENIFLGKELRKPGLGKLGILDWTRMHKESAKLLKDLETTTIDLKALTEPVFTLSGGEKQAVAISRALYGKERLRLLILDEPTAALGVNKTKDILDMLKRINKALGLTMLMISHSMPDVFAICDRIIILRNGKLVGIRETESTSIDEIISFITGSKKENYESNKS